MPVQPTPTVYDVARTAGVSIATVSRVINTPELVRRSTRQRVLAVIDTLGFVPQAEAVARARREVGRIGVITPYFTYPSFVQRMRGIATALANSPYELTIYPVDSLERLQNYLAVLPLTRRVDGLILLSLPLGEQAAASLQASQLHTVLVEHRCRGLSSVEIDDQAGGSLAAQYLLDKGHRQMAFIRSGDEPDYSIKPELRRLAGFRQTLARAGLQLPDDYLAQPPLTLEQVRAEVQRLISLPQPPTALFAASDDLAMRVLRVLRELELSAPKDLAVIGFDNTDMADLIGLTTIDQSLDDSGRLAAELLIDRLADPGRPAKNVIIQLQVVPRLTA